MALGKIFHRSSNSAYGRYWQSQSILVMLFAGLLILGSGCGESSTETEKSSDGSPSDIQTAVASDFPEQVVIPTYELLVEKAGELSKTVEALVEDANDDTLKAAQEAWIEARSPWERSEAFAFGPADSLGYDGDLDDWPVNETDVTKVIDSSDELTAEYIEELQTTQKGFHTIEFLLFGLDNDKQATDFSERELEYLQTLAVAFDETANELVQSWSEGVEGNPPYKEVLATAGDSENTAYPSKTAAIEEIVQGMMGCLDEVANEKIGEPLESKETLGLESRFSHTSINDFQHNIRSVQNAYLGEVPNADTSGASLSDLVAEANPELDEQVKEEMQAAIDAVEAIPAPIEEKLTDEDAQAKMETAQEAILTLFSTMEEKVLPLVQEPS